ncbi:Nramp family divalent metal transporter [Dyella sp.]|uniref:Nramp family divalent metal transporter n=1 Tax=Dyella sp. TaxID=1869338 RepID=UPI002ED1DDEC
MNTHILQGPLAVDRSLASVRRALDMRGRGWKTFFKLAGPAVVVSVAYVDPGNLATNIQAGAAYGYRLLWVALLASVLAMFFQALSARLGIVTGRNLAQLIREQFPRPLVIGMWIVSEIAAMATELAELVGGALGLSLLLGIPMLMGMAIVVLATWALLMLERCGFRPLERIIGVLVGVIGLCYLAELFVADLRWRGVMDGLIQYHLPDQAAVLLAVGILGATVMPHALFLHSGLTQARVPPRNEAEKSRLLRYSRIEVVAALGVAALINLAMIATAAAAFHHGHAEVARLQDAYHALTPLLGAGAAGLFLVSLIASGVSSSVVGTMAGQLIADGFLRRRTPLWLRRLATMLPALVVIAMGLDATAALIDSQIVLSFALPVPMIALVWFTRQKRLMGRHRSGAVVHGFAILATMLVLGLNGLLVAQALGLG